MTTSDSPRPAPAWRPLDARQRRVLGVLVEKAKTTPAGYPMSVLAIVAGCNQKNNRDPLTAYDEADVEEALRQLCGLGAASEIDWMGRVPKYKHHAYDWLGVDRPESAVMTELLLRGAQALGDLRGRAARMEPIADLAALKPIVEGLVARGLMLELTPPGRGQIVTHNLHPSHELAEVRSRFTGAGAGSVSAPGPVRDASAREVTSAPGVAELAAEVAELRAEVGRLREVVRRLESGGSGD